MNIHDLVSKLVVDTKGTPSLDLLEVTSDSSISAFMPELLICLTIAIILLVRVPKWGRRIDVSWIALIGLSAAFYFAAIVPQSLDLSKLGAQASEAARVSRMEIFTGMLVYDTFTAFIRVILLSFAILFVVFTKLSGIPDRDDAPDVYSLVMGATLGMCLMASANHLLMVFLAVEMASVPSYVLAGLLKGRKRGSEAALKYAVYGAGAAGVMLYGISLVSGIAGSVHLPTIAAQLAANFPTASGEQMVLAMGGLMIGVGLAFKLSAVPFHFWCPDVFEGASAEVNAFLSVASKAGALALLVRVAIGFGVVPVPPVDGLEPGARTAVKRAADADKEKVAGLFSVDDSTKSETSKEGEPAETPSASDEPQGVTTDALGGIEGKRAAAVIANAELAPVRDFIGRLIAFIAIITCTFGNLAAYGQTNIKRLLAYSTIAHAGYMMMAVSAVMALAGTHASAAERAVAGLGIYIFTYMFMNLGAFAIVAFLRNIMRSEEIADYSGLIRRCPIAVICFSLILFSLVGLPPLSGFIGKFAIFASLAEGYQATSKSYLIVLLVAGGINTALSLFYYLRVVKVMTMNPEPEGRGEVSLPAASMPGVFVLLMTAPTAFLILCWDWVNEWAQTAAQFLILG